jgi:CheY-like chemotaxis protein
MSEGVLLNASDYTILCVDDEILPLTLRTLVLQKQGYQVKTANSASDAMQMIETSAVDLVLTDQLMPGATGTELARQIKLKMPKMPVVILSGVNEIPSDAAYADHFISKVEGPRAMCDQIRAVLMSSAHEHCES